MKYLYTVITIIVILGVLTVSVSAYTISNKYETDCKQYINIYNSDNYNRIDHLGNKVETFCLGE